jgi:hypothetical protein
MRWDSERHQTHILLHPVSLVVLNRPWCHCTK